MRPLSPVEAAAAVALLGSILAATVPTFVRNLHASRMAEPLEGLTRIAARATALAAGAPPEAAYPESAPLTPAEVPRAELVTDAPGTWDHPTWRLLDFRFTVPHAYSFEFESGNSAEQSRFIARAHGDLDGDGVQSTFSIAGEVKRGEEPRVLPMDIHREVE
jgi:hypothetical protein